MRYAANISDTFFGEHYQAGEEVKVPKGAEVAAGHLASTGKLTAYGDDDPLTVSGGRQMATHDTGEQAEPSSDFDAGAILDQNAKTVIAALRDKDLTNEQLAAVQAAEEGRDKPRKSVLEAISAKMTED